MILVPIVITAYLLLYAFAYVVPPLPQAAEQQPLETLRDAGPSTLTSLAEWLDRERAIALDKLLANVAPGGRNVQDAASGSVIASPSKERPNYYYQWVRDAGITVQTLVDFYSDDPSSNISTAILPILEAYASLQHKIQRTSNPSGSFEDALNGLGEPKFHADGSAFTGSWGRPQRDGPALRALTLMSYLRAYNASNPSLWNDEDSFVEFFRPLYSAEMPANSVIKADLEYVSHYWRNPGFDLWEEIQGLHFFTAMVQLRALHEGSELAAAFADTGAAQWYRIQAQELETMMHRFWSPDKGHLVATLDFPRTGLDCALLLGSLHGHASPTSAHTMEDQIPNIYPPHSDELLLSLVHMLDDQRYRFPINSKPGWQDSWYEDQNPLTGIGIGRYPEDVYDGYGTSLGGGNPWFLCTSSVAEVLYRTSSHIQQMSELTITERGLPFWGALLNSTLSDAMWNLESTPGTYHPGDEVFEKALEGLRARADEFLEVVKTHTDAEGSLSEQFDRVSGYERGATDLTWSYGAFLQAVRARDAVL